MDYFGIITRSDWLLSPGAKIMLRALKVAAVPVYGVDLSSGEPES
jgi:hypothetical protein